MCIYILSRWTYSSNIERYTIILTWKKSETGGIETPTNCNYVYTIYNGVYYADSWHFRSGGWGEGL